MLCYMIYGGIPSAPQTENGAALYSAENPYLYDTDDIFFRMSDPSISRSNVGNADRSQRGDRRNFLRAYLNTKKALSALHG